MKKLLILLMLPLFSVCQIPEPLPNTYVNDLSGVLTADQVGKLNQKILSIEKKSSVQIAIIVINELPNDTPIDDYTLQVGRKWHVGNANNGLVYVAAINQRKQRLEVANKLQGDIPDVEALHITDNIKPYFRNKDYYGGINELLDGINKRVDPFIKEQLKLAAIEQDKKAQNVKDGFMTFFMWLLGLIAAFLLVRFVFLRNYFKAKKEEKKKEEERDAKKWASSMPIYTGIGGYMAGRSSRDDYSSHSSNDYSSGSSSSRSSSSSSDDSNSYGNWGSGSSGSDSSSGFSGGGSSNDW